MSKKALRRSHGGNTKDIRMRQQLAQEAARLIAEEGIADFHVAKQKAATRLHAPNTHNLPRNDEIQLALNQYQALFKGENHGQNLLKLRQISLRAIDFFQRFEPRIVGPVVDGTATEFSNIQLHIFADTPEQLSVFLINEYIPYEQESKRITMPNGEAIDVPCYKVVLEDKTIELILFHGKSVRHTPRCPITGKAMQRLSRNKLAELIRFSAAQ